MKYRILLSGGSSAIIADFFRFTDSQFKCLTTSSYTTDILNHFELFRPDAYVCFVDGMYKEMIEQIRTIRESKVYNGAPVIMVGTVETCNEIESASVKSPDLLVKRPISTDNLALTIVRFLEEKAEREANGAQAQAADTAEPPAEETLPDESPAKKHILIVDDDRSILKLLKTALSGEYEVTTMLNGVLVDKFLDSKPVDLIILDYEMPIETGAEIFRRIKKNKKTENIPVCFLTGVAEREKIIEIMRLKPHSYLLKPIDMDMLRSVISNLTT